MSGNVKPGVWGAQCFAGSDSGFLMTCQRMGTCGSDISVRFGRITRYFGLRVNGFRTRYLKKKKNWTFL